MKRLIFITLTFLMLVVAASTSLRADEGDECPCGTDETTGECLPCEGE